MDRRGSAARGAEGSLGKGHPVMSWRFLLAGLLVGGVVAGAGVGPKRAAAQTIEAFGQSDPRVVQSKGGSPLAQEDAALANVLGAMEPDVRLDALDHAALLAEDTANAATEKRLRIGMVREIPLGTSAGTWHSVAGVGEVWTLGLTSDGAVGLRVHFTEVNLPDGGQLAVWSATDAVLMDGPFTGRGPLEEGEFWTTVLPGEAAVVAYVAPAGAGGAGAPPFTVAGVLHLYRDFLAEESPSPLAGTCHNDVTCYPEWHPLRNAVARIQFIDGGQSFVCTGQLLNSLNGDLTPYFLTANHCIGSQAAASTLVAYWLYQTSSCNGAIPALISRPQSAFAELLAFNIFADSSLLMVRGTLPPNVFWSGWTPNAVPAGAASACIHHPRGEFKRISFGNRDASVGDFWRIAWTDGPTEGGSSGSGIWRSDTQQLYGQLSGGPSSCQSVTFDDFGKFSTGFGTFGSLLSGGSDDNLEPNNSCAAATVLSAGRVSNRIVKWADSDWYAIDVPPCADLNVSTSFTHAFGDIDIRVYDTCGGAPVAVSDGVRDGENVLIPGTPTGGRYYVHVYLFDNTRNTYTLDVHFSGVGGDSAGSFYAASSGLPVAIPDNSTTGVTRSMAVVELGTILDVDVMLRIDHTWNGDIVAELSHGGTKVKLIDRPGVPASTWGFDNNGFDVVLDDAAATSIETFNSGGPRVTGRFVPFPGALVSFNGLDMIGTWTLTVADHGPGDTGFLVGWGLRIRTTGMPCARTDGAADVCRLTDASLDMVDVAYFQTCFTGPGPVLLSGCCAALDADADGDVDMADAAALAMQLTGP